MKTIQNPKQVRILEGDSLRTIAARHLGNQTRWRELVELNGLRPPYIIQSIDPTDRLPHTLIYGDWILLPIADPQKRLTFDQESLGRDIAIEFDQSLPTNNGDLVVVVGVDNLNQAVRNRFKCERGANFAHRTYGSDIYAALGLPLMPLVEIFAAMVLKQTLIADPRLTDVYNISVVADGDTLNCSAQAHVINDNTDLDFNLSFPLKR